VATSLLCRCNGIWETIGHNRVNRHNGRLPAPTCYGLATDLLRGSCGETDVIGFGLNPALVTDCLRQIIVASTGDILLPVWTRL